MRKEKILLAGGSGLIGSYLTDFFIDKGYEVSILSRSNHSSNKFKSYKWDLSENIIDTEALHADYIINLNGAGIVDQRWSTKRKEILIQSRTRSNLLLLKGIKSNGFLPKAIMCASAVGIYGDRKEEVITEKSDHGPPSFMVDCCMQWEASARQLEDFTQRLSIIRIGIVLSTKGGALQKFKLPLTLGQANYFGNGENYYPWIHIEDLGRLFESCVKDERYKGVFNGVSPNPEKSKNFMRILKEKIAPYAILYPLPQWLLKIILGERSKAITNGARVFPERAQELGFEYKFSNLREAITDLRSRKI